MTHALRAALFAGGLGAMGLCGAALAQDLGGLGGFRHNADQPIEIASDLLEVRQQENMAIFEGSVDARQGEARLQAQKIEVWYQPGGGEGDNVVESGIRRLRASGEVFITNGAEVAQGDWADYEVATGIISMGDNVLLTQGENNAIKGSKLTINLNTGQARIVGGQGTGGRIQMIFEPGSAPQ